MIKEVENLRPNLCFPASLSSLQEPSNKRVRPLGRVSSLANLISPVRNGAVRRFGQTIQSMSFRGDGNGGKTPGVPQKPCSKAVAPTPPKRRNSTLWSETLDVHQKGTFSTKEIKRQEVRVNTVTIDLYSQISLHTNPNRERMGTRLQQ